MAAIANPCIMPWILLICLIKAFFIWVDQKALTSADGKAPPLTMQDAFSGCNKMNENMIAGSRAEGMTGSTYFFTELTDVQIVCAVG